MCNSVVSLFVKYDKRNYLGMLELDNQQKMRLVFKTLFSAPTYFRAVASSIGAMGCTTQCVTELAQRTQLFNIIL